MKKILSFFISLMLIALSFFGCDAPFKKNTDTTEINATVNSSVIEAIYPVNCQVDVHTKKQAKYFEKEYDKLPFGVKGKKELSHPEAIEFCWSYSGDKGKDTEFVLSISESEDMKNAKTYSSFEESFSVYNLKIATDYYWTVSANEKTSAVNKFTTASVAPRNIYVDGITNVRDIGGWITENGTRTKQGLIYRCGRLNESMDNGCSVIITDDGKNVMLNDLGIKTEIDVRQLHTGETGGITSSPLGNGVKYISCPMDWTGDLHNENNEQLLKIFEILSNEENYPLIIHCSIGTDRTGMLSFLINALLGVPEEDLCRDYLFSNYALIGGKRDISKLTESAYYKDIKKAQGKTLSEKAYNYLSELGVPAEQLDFVISIFSE